MLHDAGPRRQFLGQALRIGDRPEAAVEDHVALICARLATVVRPPDSDCSTQRRQVASL